MKHTKTTEQLKALEALFSERNENPIPKSFGKAQAKRNRKEKELDIEYRKACMRPVDLYNIEIKGATKKPNSDFRKAEKLEISRGKKVKGGRKVIKIKMLKD